MRIKSGFVMQKIANEYVVVCLGQSKNINGIIRLNGVGAFLWEKLYENECDESDLLSMLLEEYDVSRETALLDIRKFITALSMAGLLCCED